LRFIERPCIVIIICSFFSFRVPTMTTIYIYAYITGVSTGVCVCVCILYYPTRFSRPSVARAPCRVGLHEHKIILCLVDRKQRLSSFFFRCSSKPDRRTCVFLGTKKKPHRNSLLAGWSIIYLFLPTLFAIHNILFWKKKPNSFDIILKQIHCIIYQI